jgi:hypothetical protein
MRGAWLWAQTVSSEKKRKGGETRQAGEYDCCPIKMCARFCECVGCRVTLTSLLKPISSMRILGPSKLNILNNPSKLLFSSKQILFFYVTFLEVDKQLL